MALRSGNLSSVTWSKDGKTLYAGGRFIGMERSPVLAWAHAGQGERRTLPAGSNTVAGLAALPDGRLLVAAQDPLLGAIGARRQTSLGALFAQGRLSRSRTTERCRQTAPLSISVSSYRGKSPLRFDLRARKLSGDPPADRQTIPAKATGLAVEGWRNAFSPTLDGKPIKLQRYETIAKPGNPPERGSICAWSGLVPASDRREG